ncbi:single-stranded DNA-binding protein [Vibrio sp. LaRot3]|uniref:single-stranded DNA-binding protein n=1 Tax=Vibrio sp. LaRot3 TaxID=2998829 RepID=UPI0022CDCC0E|nr:single-stranded DNA-binding protein [Vibrio sp. LaRot3]MDA0148340.1 single-stranded DNA-binding protein [Vibrio sp. LaRot3]
MAMCIDIAANGVLVSQGQITRPSDCTAFVMVSSAEYSQLMTHQSLSPAQVGTAVSFGFAIVFGLGYLSTYGVALAKRLIKLI